MWAGLTLARFRGQDVVEDGMFFDALRDQNDATPTVLDTQLRHVLGWDRHTTDWAWDNDTSAPDRIHVVAIPPKTEGETRDQRRERRRNPMLTPLVTYERGCLTALRVTATQWQVSAPGILQSCPLDRVELLEVPGLMLRLLNHNGWRITGELKPQMRERRVLRERSVHTLVPVNATIPFPDEPGHSRDELPSRIVNDTAQVLARLHYFAGFSWTGPQPSTLTGRRPQVGADPAADLPR